MKTKSTQFLKFIFPIPTVNLVLNKTRKVPFVLTKSWFPFFCAYAFLCTHFVKFGQQSSHWNHAFLQVHFFIPLFSSLQVQSLVETLSFCKCSWKPWFPLASSSSLCSPFSLLLSPSNASDEREHTKVHSLCLCRSVSFFFLFFFFSLKTTCNWWKVFVLLCFSLLWVLFSWRTRKENGKKSA